MIRVGIGGWVFAPWRGTFYPPGLPRAQELAFASRQLTSIEINATFYRTQSPSSFRRWRDETPDGFVFAVKAPRAATHLRAPSDAAPFQRFFESGVLELGDKLGPILWQFPKTLKFDPTAVGTFLGLLPQQVGGRRIRHVVEVSHPSFDGPEFLALLRAQNVAVAMIDSAERPRIEEVTSDFIYARLRQSVEAEPTGYSRYSLDSWAAKLRLLARTPIPVALNKDDALPASAERECFVYFISGAKVRAPAAARALIERLS